MNEKQIHAVTGAFGYSGKYITKRLLARNDRVICLTNSLNRHNPFGSTVQPFPFDFDHPEKLQETLKDVSVLYNTYWVRFNHKNFTHSEAVTNTELLFKAAKTAGVKRIVHISITNPSPDSSLEYFKGKAHLEHFLKQTGVSYAILRPTVLFGKEDVLINNIAWMLRRFPVFGVFGDGRYPLQPVYVEDLAELAVQQGLSGENVIVNAVGPETFTYRKLVSSIGNIIGHRRPIISVPPWLGYLTARMIGIFVHDVLITKQEIEGLMAGLLCVESSPSGLTKLTDWATKHAETLGVTYTSELSRRIDRESEYHSN